MGLQDRTGTCRRQSPYRLIYSSLSLSLSLSHSMLHRSFPLNNFCFYLPSKLLNTFPLIYPRHAIFKTGFVCGALMKKWRAYFGNVAINKNIPRGELLDMQAIVFAVRVVVRGVTVDCALAMEWYSTHHQHCSRATRTWRNYRGWQGQGPARCFFSSINQIFIFKNRKFKILALPLKSFI